ncbi:MAG TPA: molybdopterin-dependent oxidoreductase [Steroidobacteraceae bacterium]
MNRRNWIQRVLAAAGSLSLGACDRLAESPRVNSALDVGESWTHRVQRVLLGRSALAPEYSEKDITGAFKPNGTTNPNTTEYNAHVASRFADWQLVVDGLVARPLQLSLDELRQMPSRTQITRHDCVEGWSCIAKWKGVRLSALAQRAGLLKSARFLAFHCADTLEQPPDGNGRYYETIDLIDAMHPQTILAYDMNGSPVDVRHGAPLRLRLERQLGYKMAKYVTRIEAVDSLAHLGRGKGGFWEDRGYQWYAGI